MCCLLVESNLLTWKSGRKLLLFLSKICALTNQEILESHEIINISFKIVTLINGVYISINMCVYLPRN